MRDLRLGLRQLLRNRAFAMAAVLTLALGIGANTVIFSAFNAILLRPLPYQNPEQLVWVWARLRKLGYERLPPNWANELFSEIMEASRSIESWARIKGKGFVIQKR